MPVTAAPVFVSGASGYIASWLVKELLAHGYRVRGSVRSLARAESYAHLTALPGAAERLELVEADLMTPGAFDAPVRGCEVVMHTASPYFLDPKDPQRDLVDPALHGTRSMLQACARADVRRVVLTSSVAAVTDEPETGRTLTEQDWNTRSSLTRNPYYYSKTLAEREAWRMAEGATYRLVVINPFVVIGPAMTRALNPSNFVVQAMLRGAYPGILRMTWGLVDVRDVARAHVLAMEVPGAEGRHLCCAGTMSMRSMCDLLLSNGWTSYGVPTRPLDHALGDALVWLGSWAQQSGTGSYLRTHIGRIPRIDNSKIQRSLGLRFRPLDRSVLETADDLRRWGHVGARA